MFEEVSKAEETDGEVLQAEHKRLTVAVNEATISVVDKDKLRVQLQNIFEKLKVWKKQFEAERSEAAMAEGIRLATEAAANSTPIIVTRMDGLDGKVVKKLFTEISKIAPESSYLFVSVDEDADKLSVYDFVCKSHITAGLSAKDWVNACIEIAGNGKGGGRPEQSQCNIQGVEHLSAVVDAALSFAQAKL